MNQEKVTILIIDDEEPLRESMGAVLENAGYAVAKAANGEAALALMREKFFDILLVDYMLPDMDGLECIRKALAVSKDSVPIVITGSNSVEIAVEAMRIGVHDYLVKPIDMDDLLKALSVILVEREEFRKGKMNLDQIINALQGEADMGITTIVLSEHRPEKRKVSMREQVRQIVEDVVGLVRPSTMK